MHNSPWKRVPLPAPMMPELSSDIARLQELDREREVLLRRIERHMVLSAPIQGKVISIKPGYIPRERESILGDTWED